MEDHYYEQDLDKISAKYMRSFTGNQERVCTRCKCNIPRYTFARRDKKTSEWYCEPCGGADYKCKFCGEIRVFRFIKYWAGNGWRCIKCKPPAVQQGDNPLQQQPPPVGRPSGDLGVMLNAGAPLGGNGGQGSSSASQPSASEENVRFERPISWSSRSEESPLRIPQSGGPPSDSPSSGSKKKGKVSRSIVKFGVSTKGPITGTRTLK